MSLLRDVSLSCMRISLTGHHRLFQAAQRELERQRKEEETRRRRGELQIKKEQEQNEIIKLKAKKRSLEMELEAVVKRTFSFQYNSYRKHTFSRFIQA